MRPKKVTVTGVGVSPWLPLDPKQAPFNVSVGCVLVSGTATYTVEHTFDDVYGGGTLVAFPNSGITAATTSKDGNYSAPVEAIRLNVTGGASPVVYMIVSQGLR